MPARLFTSSSNWRVLRSLLKLAYYILLVQCVKVVDCVRILCHSALLGEIFEKVGSRDSLLMILGMGEQVVSRMPDTD